MNPREYLWKEFDGNKLSLIKFYVGSGAGSIEYANDTFIVKSADKVVMSFHVSSHEAFKEFLFELYNMVGKKIERKSLTETIQLKEDDNANS